MGYKLLFGVCGVMYIEDTFGELWSRLLCDDTVYTELHGEQFSIDV
jgi:hypothetical protein